MIWNINFWDLKKTSHFQKKNTFKEQSDKVCTYIKLYTCHFLGTIIGRVFMADWPGMVSSLQQLRILNPWENKAEFFILHNIGSSPFENVQDLKVRYLGSRYCSWDPFKNFAWKLSKNWKIPKLKVAKIAKIENCQNSELLTC